jgi:hypothetical protein
VLAAHGFFGSAQYTPPVWCPLLRLPAGEVEVADADAAELGATHAAVEQDEEREAVTRRSHAAKEQFVDVGG